MTEVCGTSCALPSHAQGVKSAGLLSALCSRALRSVLVFANTGISKEEDPATSGRQEK